jgi:fatty-acyl-CoA synthase
LITAWAARGIFLATVFGITEAGACVTTVAPGHESHRAGVIGLPVLYARCRVCTGTGAEARPGEIGELQITGDLVTIGYWRNPEATSAAFTADGWLRTGDAATIGVDGQFLLVDRWKDMYISGGENVYPAEIENVLHGHPDVSQVAVVAAPHPRWGEAGVAFVVLTRHTPVRDLIAWCRAHLAAYKVPVHVVTVDELPRNATGKVLKAPLRAEAQHVCSA